MCYLDIRRGTEKEAEEPPRSWIFACSSCRPLALPPTSRSHSHLRAVVPSVPFAWNACPFRPPLRPGWDDSLPPHLCPPQGRSIHLHLTSRGVFPSPQGGQQVYEDRAGMSVAQSHATVCDHIDYSPPGSSARSISQARILEWLAISHSRGPFPNPGIEPRSPALQADSFLSEPPGTGHEFHNLQINQVYGSI